MLLPRRDTALEGLGNDARQHSSHPLAKGVLPITAVSTIDVCSTSAPSIHKQTPRRTHATTYRMIKLLSLLCCYNSPDGIIETIAHGGVLIFHTKGIAYGKISRMQTMSHKTAAHKAQESTEHISVFFRDRTTNSRAKQSLQCPGESGCSRTLRARTREPPPMLQSRLFRTPPHKQSTRAPSPTGRKKSETNRSTIFIITRVRDQDEDTIFLPRADKTVGIFTAEQST